jgi:DNA-binding response OmpR family regulator
MTRQCIFALDDDAIVGELMAIEIEAAGYDVRAFSNVHVAMQYMPRAQPALLILDLNMPEMNGLDVLSALRSKGLLHRTVVLVLSGSVDPDARDQALRLGAAAYMVKPVTCTELRAAVSRLLSIRSAPEQAGPSPESTQARCVAAPGRINPVSRDLQADVWPVRRRAAAEHAV